MEHLDLIQDLAKIEARFREILKAPKLIIDLNKSWGAEHPTHRLDIRQGILMKFPQADSQQLLNLQNPPSRPLGTSDSPSFSVSHTIGLGGYAASAHGSVGFDIELVNRVTAKIAARVSIGEELALAPNPSVLWVAKEATFKSLLPLRQPSTLSQFETFRWKKIDSLFETFLLKQPEQFGATAAVVAFTAMGNMWWEYSLLIQRPRCFLGHHIHFPLNLRRAIAEERVRK